MNRSNKALNADPVAAHRVTMRLTYQQLEARARRAGMVNEVVKAQNESIRAESRILIAWFQENRAALTKDQ